jgi:hypothetical protein
MFYQIEFIKIISKIHFPAYLRIKKYISTKKIFNYGNLKNTRF